MKNFFYVVLFTAVATIAGINMKLGMSCSDSMPVLTLNNVEQLSNAELIVSYNGYVGVFSWNPGYVLEIGTSGQSRVAKINGTWIMTSDSRAKENVRDLPNSLDLVSRLRGVNYNWKGDASAVDKQLQGRDVFGFIAEEVKEVLPNLVFEDDSTGMLALDYNGVIPLLTNAIQEQQKQIAALQQQVSSLLALRSSQGTTDVDEVAVQSAALYQNTPNPFTENTEIRYQLPENTKTAEIYIFDLQGKLIKTYAADTSGAVLVKGSDLQAGIYSYTLVADGRQVDTKKMILTK